MPENAKEQWHVFKYQGHDQSCGLNFFFHKFYEEGGNNGTATLNIA